jgi:ATP-dependent RNA helicase DDX21
LFTDAYAHRAGRAGRPGCAVRGASLLLPPPGPEHAAAVARLERDAKVAVRRLTAVGEREARGRSVAAAAASAAAASRSSDSLLDGVGVATSSPVSEEDARAARARLGERMLVADRFGEFTGELSELRGGRSGKSGKSRGKGKGRR